MADTAAGPGAGSVRRRISGGAGMSCQATEAFVIPLAALIVGMVLSSLFILAVGKSPLQLYETMGAASARGSPSRTRCHGSTTLRHGALRGAAGRLGLVVIGGEGAIVLGGVAPLPRRALAARHHRRHSCHGRGGHGRRRHLDRCRQRASPLPCRQRNRLQPADGLYCHRPDEPSGGGRCAIRLAQNLRPSRWPISIASATSGMEVHWASSSHHRLRPVLVVIEKPVGALPPASPAAIQAAQVQGWLSGR